MSVKWPECWQCSDNKCFNGWMIDGLMGGWMDDGWLDGWMDEWIDG